MKKIAVMCFLTSLAVSGAFISSYIYEANLPQAYTAAVSDIVFAESVIASGEVVSYDNTMKINAVINEKNASKVKAGQSVVISGNGFGEYSGTVEKVSDNARRISNGLAEETVVDIQAGFDDSYDLSEIKSGYTASLKINISDKKNIRVVPYKAVHTDKYGISYLYIFRDGMSVRKNIVTGCETSEGTEIISGINKNDIILVADNDALSDGGFVNIEE